MLRINLDRVRNHNELMHDDKLAVQTEALAYALLGVGVSEITVKNCRDTYLRIYMYERVSGAFRYGAQGEDLPFQYEEIERHIGMKVNAPTLTKQQLLKKLWRICDDVRRSAETRTRAAQAGTRA